MMYFPSWQPFFIQNYEWPCIALEPVLVLSRSHFLYCPEATVCSAHCLYFPKATECTVPETKTMSVLPRSHYLYCLVHVVPCTALKPLFVLPTICIVLEPLFVLPRAQCLYCPRPTVCPALEPMFVLPRTLLPATDYLSCPGATICTAPEPLLVRPRSHYLSNFVLYIDSTDAYFMSYKMQIKISDMIQMGKKVRTLTNSWFCRNHEIFYSFRKGFVRNHKSS